MKYSKLKLEIRRCISLQGYKSNVHENVLHSAYYSGIPTQVVVILALCYLGRTKKEQPHLRSVNATFFHLNLIDLPEVYVRYVGE